MIVYILFLQMPQETITNSSDIYDVDNMLYNISKMLDFRSNIYSYPKFKQIDSKDDVVISGGDLIGCFSNKLDTIIVFITTKFTTSQHKLLNKKYRYIILTDKNIHYELKKNLTQTDLIEIFPTYYFNINLLDLVPHHKIYNGSIKYPNKLAKILLTDPMVLYGKFKEGTIICVGVCIRLVSR